jgi:hypothetical protein
LIVRSIVANGGVDAPLSRLDVENNFTATIRAADLEFGHSDRRGEPGIALVDGRDSLIINFDSAWPQTEVQSKLIAGRGKGNGYGAEIHGHLEVHGGGLVVDDDVEILGKLKLPNSQFELQRGFSSAIAVGRHLLQSTTIGDTRAVVLCAKVSVSSDNGGPPNEVILVHDGEELARKTVLTSTATTISAVAALGGTVELFLDCKTGGIQWNIEYYFTGFWL